MTHVAQINMDDAAVTPLFKYLTIEDVPQSEIQGQAVMKTIPVVEVRFAGHKLYSPVMPVDAFWMRDGHKTMTYAERWKEQYAAFMEGEDQIASGTPLEMLKSFGITPSQLSLCRAMKIHSVEALNSGSVSAKNLGMAGNFLKEIAQRFMEERNSGSADRARIADLEAQIAALKAGNVIPAVVAELDAAVDPALAQVNAEEDEKSRLKDEIVALGNPRPKGNRSPDTLRSMLAELKG